MTDPHVGRTYEGYTVTRKIGTGGMGVVYEALDRARNRAAAIKFPHPEFAGEKEYIDRFLREGHTAEQVKHVNIVETYKVGTANGLPFIAMEFVPGRPLSMAIRKAIKFDPATAIDTGLQIAAALEKIHDFGITHRDLKPDNVMVKANGLVKLMDFGIAGRKQAGVDRAMGLTDFVGTPHYIPPEQCLGEKTDPRSDIYALGVVFFEMLTGRAPFVHEDRDQLLKLILEEPMPSIRASNPMTPKALEDIVEKAMAKLPSDRFRSITDMAGQIALTAKEMGFKMPHRTDEPAPPPELPLPPAAAKEPGGGAMGFLRKLFGK